MTAAEPGGTPLAVPGAPPAVAAWSDVNGCRLYTEVRGAGPPLLIIGAASDDAEVFRPIAERLSDFTVVTWDPRGTLRSARDGWPCDSARHADDAAALLQQLGLAPAAIFGASAGGIVAVQLALRHPALVRQVLAYEPGYFRHTASGAALLSRATDAVTDHLRARPGDWAGAMTRLFLAAAEAPGSLPADLADDTGPGLLDAPPGLDWYVRRGIALAENFIRDDLARTQESVDPELLSSTATDIHFGFGSESPPVFREITEALTRIRHRPGSKDPLTPDRVDGAGHLVYYTPEPICRYIRRRAQTPKGPVATTDPFGRN